MGLFEAGEGRGHVPLADRLRPRDFDGLALRAWLLDRLPQGGLERLALGA